MKKHIDKTKTGKKGFRLSVYYLYVREKHIQNIL